MNNGVCAVLPVWMRCELKLTPVKDVTPLLTLRVEGAQVERGELRLQVRGEGVKPFVDMRQLRKMSRANIMVGGF